MKLKQIETPTFTFRHVFPNALNGLGPDGCDELFIKIEARAGGPLNMQLTSDLEALAKSAIILDKQRAIIEKAADEDKDAAREAIEAAYRDNEEMKQRRAEIIYDNCVVSWETNICSETGDILEPTRDNFVALVCMSVTAFADMFDAFMECIGEFTREIVGEDEADLKN